MVTRAVYTHEPGSPGKLISQHRTGTTSYFLYDGLGNTRALADSAGNITDTYAYQAYGTQISETGNTPNNYHYVGRYGYYYDYLAPAVPMHVRARNLSTGQARFVSVDPRGTTELDLNLYPYVRNNPVNAIDPSGLACIVDDYCKGTICITGATGTILTKDCKVTFVKSEKGGGPEGCRYDWQYKIGIQRAVCDELSKKIKQPKGLNIPCRDGCDCTGEDPLPTGKQTISGSSWMAICWHTVKNPKTGKMEKVEELCTDDEIKNNKVDCWVRVDAVITATVATGKSGTCAKTIPKDGCNC